MSNVDCPVCKFQTYCPVGAVEHIEIDNPLTSTVKPTLDDELLLKQYCRNGLQSQHRITVYTELIQQNSNSSNVIKLNKQYEQYKHLWLNGNSINIINTSSDAYIPLFGCELCQLTLPDIVILPNDQLTRLKTILCVLKYTYTEIQYCPQIVYIAIQLIQIYDDEATVYALLCTMIQRSQNDHYYIHTTYPSLYKHAIVISKLIKHRYKQTYKHLQSMKFDLIKYIMYHIQSLFHHILTDSNALLRVYDCYMNEGDKILIRVMLALIQLNKHQIKKCSNIQQVVTLINGTLQKYTVKQILTVAFAIQLTRDEIATEQKKTYNTSCSAPNIPTPTNHLFQPVQSDVMSNKRFWDIYTLLPINKQSCDFKLLYSNALHGYNYKTMLSHCSNHKSWIILIGDTSQNVFGAYLSNALPQLNAAQVSMVDSDTFVFTIQPNLLQYKHRQYVDKTVDNEYCHDHRRATSTLTSHHTSKSVVTTTSTAKKQNFVDQQINDSTTKIIDQVCHSTHISQNDAFVVVRDDILAIGDITGCCLAIDAQLKLAYTQTCKTFNNEPLFQQNTISKQSSNKLHSTDISDIEVYTLSDT